MEGSCSLCLQEVFIGALPHSHPHWLHHSCIFCSLLQLQACTHTTVLKSLVSCAHTHPHTHKPSPQIEMNPPHSAAANQNRSLSEALAPSPWERGEAGSHTHSLGNRFVLRAGTKQPEPLTAFLLNISLQADANTNVNVNVVIQNEGD